MRLLQNVALALPCKIDSGPSSTCMLSMSYKQILMELLMACDSIHHRILVVMVLFLVKDNIRSFMGI